MKRKISYKFLPKEQKIGRMLYKLCYNNFIKAYLLVGNWQLRATNHNSDIMQFAMARLTHSGFYIHLLS